MKKFTTFLSMLAFVLFLGMGAGMVMVLTATDAQGQLTGDYGQMMDNTDVETEDIEIKRDIRTKPIFLARSGDGPVNNDCRDAADPYNLELAMDEVVFGSFRLLLGSPAAVVATCKRKVCCSYEDKEKGIKISCCSKEAKSATCSESGCSFGY